MRIPSRLARLFTTEDPESPAPIPDALQERVLAGLDLNRFEEIRDRYSDADPYPGYSKYLDLDTWMREAIGRLMRLGLNDSPSLSILDIGTGAGYFPFACGQLGHRCVTLDVPDVEMYNALVDLLGIERHDMRVEPFTPLPDFGRSFDLVTAFRICFNAHATENLWGPAEWDFFIQDLLDNHVAPGGRILFELNAEPDGSYWTPELRTYFNGVGSTCEKGFLRITRQSAACRRSKPQ